MPQTGPLGSPPPDATRETKIAYYAGFLAKLPGTYQGNFKQYKGMSWADLYTTLATADDTADPLQLADAILGIEAAQRLGDNLNDADSKLGPFIGDTEKGLGNTNFAGPLGGPLEIAAVFEAVYHQLTKVSLWRSLGWLALGTVLTVGGVAWWVKTDAIRGVTNIAKGGKPGLQTPVLPLATVMTGLYVMWFSIHYWEDTSVIWPSDPMKRALQGKGLPSRTADITATAFYTSAISADTANAAKDGSKGKIPKVSPSGGSYPNSKTIMSYLVSQGYTPVAAAGIYGNMYQESGGNPEAGGPGNAGLIQWTPGSVASPYQPVMTGNPAYDLGRQLADVMEWNTQNNALPNFMNTAVTPDQAAEMYMNQAERPGIPALANRQAAAQAVYSEYTSGGS